MIVFKILLVLIGLYNLIIAYFIKNNIWNLKNLFYNYLNSSEFDNFFENKFSDRYLIQAVEVLIIIILSLC